MSRAFVKDDSDAPEPRFERRPVSTLPNYVTPEGAHAFARHLARARSPPATTTRPNTFRSASTRRSSIDPAGHPHGRG